MAGAFDSEPVFQGNPLHLGLLMHQVHDGTLAIPDFQRDFTWEPRRIGALLRSLMSRYPAGSFLFWEVGPENERFGHRSVELAPKAAKKPKDLVLDGQQRLTALFHALNRVGAERFFLSIRHFVELPSSSLPGGRLRDPEDIEFESAIIWYSEESKEAKGLASREARIAEHVLAVDEHREFHEWLDEYVSYYKDSIDETATKKLLRNFDEKYLTPLKSYGFPVVQLPSHTPIEAVATVFESLNSTGKPLGPFELLTARFYPDGVHLRDLWDDSVAKYPILETFSVGEYSLLQSITLLAHKSAQRSDVLKLLNSSDVRDHWGSIAHGFASVLDFLQRECGVVSPKLLPYTMLLVPLAAVWGTVEKVKGPEQINVRNRLKQYFWCTVFMTNYDQGANSQAGADYSKLRYWLTDPTKDAPEAVSDFSLLDSNLLTATTRRKALNAGVLALTVTSGGARDFFNGDKLDPERVAARKIDSHHVFPRGYLKGKRDSGGKALNAELILNRALIDPKTNQEISSRAPSDYFQTLKDTLTQEGLIKVLQSQLIDAAKPDDPVWNDNYRGFIIRRLEDVVLSIETVTGKKVLREDPESAPSV